MSPPAPCTVHTPSPTALWLPAMAGAPISAQLQTIGQTPTPPSVVVLRVARPRATKAYRYVPERDLPAHTVQVYLWNLPTTVRNPASPASLLATPATTCALFS